MKIKRLEIKGFKSIEHLILDDVSSLTVFAGANGSGKSNVVDALRFFSMAISQTVGEAANYFGGWKNILSWRDESEKFNELFFEIVVTNDFQKNISYKLNIEFTSRKFNITHESCKIIQGDKIIFDRKINSDGNIIVKGFLINEIFNILNEDKKNEDLIEGNTAFKSDLTLLKTLFSQFKFYQFISNLKIFRIDPILAKNSPSLYDEALNENGDNIATLLKTLENTDKSNHLEYSIKEELLEWINMIVPELDDVYFSENNLNNSVALSFQERSYDKPFPAGLISDGTIYTLCILTAILSRSPEYGITIIEEPERGIHPQAIGELISLMREKAKDKHNIILTTHSEAVVRNLELDELYLVHKENGQTIINDVKNSGVDKNQIPLDEAWLTNSFDGGLPW